MMIVSEISFNEITDVNFQSKIFSRSDYEPGIVLYKQLLSKGESIGNIAIGENDKTGILSSIKGVTKYDPIDYIITEMLGSNQFMKWQKYFNKEYSHANAILFLAYKSFKSDKNSWLNYLDSFNDVLIKSFVNLLKQKIPTVNWPPTTSSTGLIDFGIIMDPNNKLSKTYPKIVDGMRSFHKRRNLSVLSHAYDKKSQKKNRFLTNAEKKGLITVLRNSYNEFFIEVDQYL